MMLVALFVFGVIKNKIAMKEIKAKVNGMLAAQLYKKMVELTSRAEALLENEDIFTTPWMMLSKACSLMSEADYILFEDTLTANERILAAWHLISAVEEYVKTGDASKLKSND